MSHKYKFFVNGLGTYYTKRSVSEGGVPLDCLQLQNLAYAVKNKWPPGTFAIQHPRLRKGPVTISDQQAACDYAAMVHATIWKKSGEMVLVPVPSSVVTECTIETARWGAYRLAKALAKHGFGTVMPLLVNRRPTNSGQTRAAAEIRENLHILGRPPTGGQIILVDDTVTRGNSIAVAREALGNPDGYALVVGVTSNIPRASALTPIRRMLTYSTTDDVVECEDRELD